MRQPRPVLCGSRQSYDGGSGTAGSAMAQPTTVALRKQAILRRAARAPVALTDAGSPQRVARHGWPWLRRPAHGWPGSGGVRTTGSDTGGLRAGGLGWLSRHRVRRGGKSPASTASKDDDSGLWLSRGREPEDSGVQVAPLAGGLLLGPPWRVRRWRRDTSLTGRSLVQRDGHDDPTTGVPLARIRAADVVSWFPRCSIQPQWVSSSSLRWPRLGGVSILRCRGSSDRRGDRHCQNGDRELDGEPREARASPHRSSPAQLVPASGPGALLSYYVLLGVTEDGSSTNRATSAATTRPRLVVKVAKSPGRCGTRPECSLGAVVGIIVSRTPARTAVRPAAGCDGDPFQLRSGRLRLPRPQMPGGLRSKTTRR